MTLWRISDHPELNGAGGLYRGARWHSLGRRVVYCAPNPATALVEVLVHIESDPDELPDPLQYLEIDAPDAVSTETVDLDSLGSDWEQNQAATRRAGDQWLEARKTALLQVPSVIVPATWNILVNPEHVESAQFNIVRVHSQRIDPRLVR